MTKNRNSSSSRKTKKIVRTPATRFAHLQKRMQERMIRETRRKKTS